jgi:hypothetical protein
MRSIVGMGVALALGLGLTAVSAAPSSLRILELDCNDEPERVVIENSGDEVLELSGWTLESDEPDETLALMSSLQGGESTAVRIEGLDFFRDADASDYARIVDPTGAVADQMNCADLIVDEPAPTAVAEASAGSPASDVPVGGGAPPAADGGMSPELLILIGGSALVLGASMVTLPRLRMLGDGSAHVELQPPARAALAATNAANRHRYTAGRSAAGTFRHRFLLLGIASAAAMLLMPLVWKRLRN